jgi:hypothetical protein
MGQAAGRRRTRLLALLAVRDEMRFLPGFIANVAPQVDGIVALDDGSADGSAEYLASRPEVLRLIRGRRTRPGWDEVANHRALVAAALELGPQWLLALDADERLERGFRTRAEEAIADAAVGASAFAVRLLELWDSPRRYRADGIWGRKAPARLFEARPDHEFDSRPLHGSKAPLQAMRNGGVQRADLIVYHLRMIRPEDRLARRRRYERLDPECRLQPGIGYAYLTDASGAELRPLPRGREYAAELGAERGRRFSAKTPAA